MNHSRFSALHFFVIIFILSIFGCRPTEPISSQTDEVQLATSSAHWVSATHFIWNPGVEASVYELRYSHDASIRVFPDEIRGGTSIFMESGAILSEELADKFRHISEWPAFSVSADDETIKEALKGQLVAIAYDDAGSPIASTKVQTHGVLDDLYTYSGDLGPVYTNDGIELSVWAPTAQSLELVMYDREKTKVATISPNQNNPSDGVWRFSADSDFDRYFYRFDITVYHPDNNRINQLEVTDPYSVSLSTDSRYSQLVDLTDESLKPAGWDDIRKVQPKHTDISLYESHMRDFSFYDMTVPEEHRGTYMAFTHNGKNGSELSDGMNHLLKLHEAGLTHLHLLPVNDIATIVEDMDERVDLSDPFSHLCKKTDHPAVQAKCGNVGDQTIYEVFKALAEDDPTTTEIQNMMHSPDHPGLSNLDGFNWGYDPFHFNAPQGSYSTNPEGEQRILELRKMVKALHEAGIKLVVDVVYNHTHASGVGDKSVLDKVVPGYYQRLDPTTGVVENSTCCPNTAAEFNMMERLIIDSIVLWAKEYKIDSFRFDLMGHHPKSVMENVQDALAQLTLEEDGVDGENIFIYGEGWNFGEVADNRIFEQATQMNLGGSGIGNFNDRIRDAIKGGFFSWDGRSQGFANGRYLFPNEENEATDETLNQLLDMGDRIRVGMTGNLSTYQYENYLGEIVPGSNNGVGYTLQPQETINYIDKHDNETLWDDTQAKLPYHFDMDRRVRIHMLKNTFINYGQGVPFYQLGTDMLRSKSMDRNSYQSGDWFNRVDYTMESHNWGSGLPPAWDNRDNWDIQREILQNPNVDVQKEHMELANQLFREQLQVRYSSPLFRLETAEEIHQRVAFHNTGQGQIPGLITMTISDGACTDKSLDSNYDGILVIFNADIEEKTIELGLNGMMLHPLQQNGADSVVKSSATSDGSFTVPGLTTAVFVMPEGANGGEFPCNRY